jgi:hypothetical protein
VRNEELCRLGNEKVKQNPGISPQDVGRTLTKLLNPLLESDLIVVGRIRKRIDFCSGAHAYF